MFNSSNVPSLSDIAAVTGNRNDNGFGDGNGWWVLIILFALFGGWGNNGWGNGGGDARPATQGDVQRGFDTQTVVSKLDGISNGLCDGLYAVNSGMLNGFNTLQNSIQQGNFGLQNAIQQNTVANMQNTNAIATQLANCCCETGKRSLRYAIIWRPILVRSLQQSIRQHRMSCRTATRIIARFMTRSFRSRWPRRTRRLRNRPT